MSIHASLFLTFSLTFGPYVDFPRTTFSLLTCLTLSKCNATGVYSGVDSTGEGGLNSTFLRGLQMSDNDGVVQFDTIFPGHYSGRATHEHTVVHTNASLLPNGSYTGGTVSHIGQIFFDESLRSAVEETYPYNTNTIEALSNDDDMWAPSQADNNYDPFPEYVYLGNDITGKILWRPPVKLLNRI